MSTSEGAAYDTCVGTTDRNGNHWQEPMRDYGGRFARRIAVLCTAGCGYARFVAEGTTGQYTWCYGCKAARRFEPGNGTS